MENKRIKNLIYNRDNFIKIISYKRKEELVRIGSNLANMQFVKFNIFDSIKNNHKLISEFDKMQEIYVFDDNDKFKYDYVCDSMLNLRQILLDLD